MCLNGQVPDEAADSINLSQKVSIVPTEETAPAVTEEQQQQDEEDKNLPEWSEKVANGILTGEAKVHPLPGISFIL